MQALTKTISLDDEVGVPIAFWIISLCHPQGIRDFVFGVDVGWFAGCGLFTLKLDLFFTFWQCRLGFRELESVTV